MEEIRHIGRLWGFLVPSNSYSLSLLFGWNFIRKSSSCSLAIPSSPGCTLYPSWTIKQKSKSTLFSFSSSWLIHGILSWEQNSATKPFFTPGAKDSNRLQIPPRLCVIQTNLQALLCNGILCSFLLQSWFFPYKGHRLGYMLFSSATLLGVGLHSTF